MLILFSHRSGARFGQFPPPVGVGPAFLVSRLKTV
jgi:hypothetical protein